MSKAREKPEKPQAKKGPPEPDEVTLEFDLFDLPTTHHKAGLAGLLMVIDSMKDLKRPNAPTYADLKATSVKVTFTADSTQALFDHLYEAKWEDVWSPSKWPGADPLDVKHEEIEDPKTKKPKKVQKFLYKVVNPRAPFLALHLQVEDGAWMKLWRDMIWKVPRGNNKTRGPFEDRAEGGPCAVGAEAWRAIVSFDAGRDHPEFASINGAIMLATMGANAEAVKFRGRADQNLLLHFWQAVVMTYAPYELDDEGKLKTFGVDKRKAERGAVGFSLALPDVADLRVFKNAFAAFLGRLANDPHPRLRFRPAGAVIDIPAESGLEFLRHLSDLSGGKSLAQSWARSVSAVDCFHMLSDGKGKTPKLLGFARIDNSPNTIKSYVAIKNVYSNQAFRATLLRNLLADRPWHRGMLELFARNPHEMFVGGEMPPKFIPRFGADAQAKFRLINQEYAMKDGKQAPDERDRLGRIVWGLVREHALRRAEVRFGRKVKDFEKKVYTARDGMQKETRDYPPAFREKVQSVCSEFFLTIRSRHDRDFVETFVATIGSWPQSLSGDDYRFLTSVLLRPAPKSPTGDVDLCWEDVKAMAMLAASAHSYSLGPKDDRPEAQTAPALQTSSEES